MSAADEEWVRAAMTDDNLVVELLVKLHRQPQPQPPPPPEEGVFPTLEWRVRQRRSKWIPVNNKPKKPSHRASPTTPLSWSGATSFGGGSEESTRQPPFKIVNTSRSKSITESDKTASKRSRKKKTLAELKGEEHLLCKEQRELKTEIAALRVHLERERTTNKALKRMKIELQPQLDRESMPESTSRQHETESPHCQPYVSVSDVSLQSSTSNAHPEEHTDATFDSEFVLPDLNIPFDEPISDIACGNTKTTVYEAWNE